MAEVRDIIKINVAPDRVWDVLAQHVASQSGGSYEVKDRRVPQDSPSPEQGIRYDTSSFGLIAPPEEEAQDRGEISMSVFERDYLLKCACATFSVTSHDGGTVVGMSIDYKAVSPGVALVGWGKRLGLSTGILGLIMLYPRLGRLLLKAVRNTLADLKKYIETGQEYARSEPTILARAA